MSDFRSWDELTQLEQYQATYWDFYKEVFGIRPRGVDTSSWTEADFEREFQSLAVAAKQQIQD